MTIVASANYPRLATKHWEGDMLVRTSVLCFSLVAMAGSALAQDRVPVSGSFDYTPEIFAQIAAGESTYFDASEDETWRGDIEGTAVSPFRMVITPDGVWDAWLYTEFEGTVLGDHEGTMVVLARYQRPAPDTHWSGEWIILSGTGDLEDVQGSGTAWGPGFNADDPNASPDIFYTGHVVLSGN